MPAFNVLIIIVLCANWANGSPFSIQELSGFDTTGDTRSAAAPGVTGGGSGAVVHSVRKLRIGLAIKARKVSNPMTPKAMVPIKVKVNRTVTILMPMR